ncbi:transient receptor potential cation channel subfamily V member 6-like isoform X2 [Ptychodera flava]
MKKTNYFGYAYFGEYPLHFAASFGNIEIYNYLLGLHGSDNVDPNAQDSFGNTVLHMIVIHDRLEMFQNVMHSEVPPNPNIQNAAGLTAMALACKMGRNELFQSMLEFTSTTLWKFGTLQCVTYPLEEVDSIKPTGELDLQSALSIIVFGDEDEHLEMVEGGVIYLLLQEKWQVFAKRQFITRFILAFLHLIALSVAVYLRPDGDLLGGTDTRDIVRYVAEVILLIDCAIYIFFEGFNIKAIRLKYIKSLIYVPAKTLFLLSCILFILCLPCRFASFRTLEDSLAIFAVPMAWGYMLFFYRGLESLGPFVTMIYKMTVGDLFPFSIIWVTILSAFSPAFYYPFKGIDDEVETFDTPYGTWMSLYHMTFGEFEALISGGDDEIDKSRIPALSKLLLCLFMILVPILLLNMLIAMMSNTYQIIKLKARREWQRQWAKIIMVLERSCSKAELRRYQQGYSIAGTKPNRQTTQPGDNMSEANSEYTRKSYASIDEVLNDSSSTEEGECCACLMIVKPTSKEHSTQKKSESSSTLERLHLQDWKVISRNARHRLAEQGKKGSKAARVKKSRTPLSSRPGSAVVRGSRNGFLA